MVYQSSVFAAQDAVGGMNSYSGKPGDEEASMSLIDEEGVANFKKQK